jgi:GNAT superfamily N-acetyltransferase
MKIKYGLLAMVGALASTCNVQAANPDFLQAMEAAANERVAIEQLSFMRLGGGFSAQVCGNVDLVRSGAKSLWYNRAIVNGFTVTTPAISAVNDMMEGVPYGWWVNSSAQDGVIRVLQANGFSRYTEKSEHVMSADYQALSSLEKPEDDSKIGFLSFHLAHVTDENLDLWIRTSATGFGLSVDEVRMFMEYIRQNASGSRVTLFLATFQGNTPMSSCMTIMHEDGTVTLHQLSTIPAARCHGLGHAIVRYALSYECDYGAKNALVLSSPEAQKLFASFGFADCATYDVYVKLADAKASLPNASSSGYCLVS